MDITFRTYSHTDYEACLHLFDANCPEAFAETEREDYKLFLKDNPSTYQVSIIDGRVSGAFGLTDISAYEARLNWILMDPSVQGMGVGTVIMERVVLTSRLSGKRTLRIAASQKSEPFFARFGATTVSRIKDGWGIGMDRVEMQLQLSDPGTLASATSVD